MQVNRDKHTFIVWTVLTGMREIATLENTCPPTWKRPMGRVLSRIAFVGRLRRVKRIRGLVNNKQYAAMKPNCTKVNVIG